MATQSCSFALTHCQPIPGSALWGRHQALIVLSRGQGSRPPGPLPTWQRWRVCRGAGARSRCHPEGRPWRSKAASELWAQKASWRSWRGAGELGGGPSTPACPDPGPGGCLQPRTPCTVRPPGPQEGNHSWPHRYLPSVRGASDRERPGARRPYRPPAAITPHPAWGSQGPPPCSASTPNGTGTVPGQAGGPGQPPQWASCSH